MDNTLKTAIEYGIDYYIEKLPFNWIELIIAIGTIGALFTAILLAYQSEKKYRAERARFKSLVQNRVRFIIEGLNSKIFTHFVESKNRDKYLKKPHEDIILIGLTGISLPLDFISEEYQHLYQLIEHFTLFTKEQEDALFSILSTVKFLTTSEDRIETNQLHTNLKNIISKSEHFFEGFEDRSIESGG